MMSHIHPSIESLTDDIIKSDTDKKSYRALKLKNEMKILIINDPDTDKSAAAMNVHIGQLQLFLYLKIDILKVGVLYTTTSTLIFYKFEKYLLSIY